MCSERPRVITGALFVDYLRWCVESVIDDPDIEPFSFTALEVAPDGSLFATRPLAGQVMIIEDSDGDQLPDTMRTFAEGLNMPSGLAYHEGDLYVSSGSKIYRISAGGSVDTIVSDLPVGAGFPVSGLVVGEDERLYVAVGAPCDNCEFDEPERGAILSMTLDGADRQVIASGFRHPADVEFYRGKLWTLDSAPRSYQRGAVDEVNQVETGAWYGFPYCLGAATVNLASDQFDCIASAPPRVLFGAGARPSSLAAYPYDTLTGTADTLIVVLSGEPTQIDFVGYKVVMLNFDDHDQPLGATLLLPFRIESTRQAYVPYEGEGYFWRQYITLSELGWGIYPQQPLAVAVNSYGWIYISMTGGQIVALRPANETPPWEDFYPIWTPMHPDYDPSA
ncbi:MAG: PQQ-dependent sugar dehydrogenase [Chloroflexi bacterium]|nr:PQQ-dependent sugar dehydrogenase [Chloroflexota bacterium]